MSTSDLTVTLAGWVGTEPKHYTGTGVTPFTSFRMANTRRYFDRAQNAWTDGRTEWFTVKVWRHSALNVASSLRKGDPVLVHGRLSTEHWDGPDGPRTSLVLEALAIGPDLTYGRATFARTVHVSGGTAEADDARPDAGAPEAGDGTGTGAYGFEDPWATDGLDVDGAVSDGAVTEAAVSEAAVSADAGTHAGSGTGQGGDDGSDARAGEAAGDRSDARADEAADGAHDAAATAAGAARGKRGRAVEAAAVA